MTEAAGLGIIDLSQIKYCGPIGLFEIYSGEWDSPNKKTIQTIVPSTDIDVYETYWKLLLKQEALKLSKKMQKEQEQSLNGMPSWK